MLLVLSTFHYAVDTTSQLNTIFIDLKPHKLMDY